VQVLGIAVDQAANVNRWIARQPLAFPVVLAGAGGVSMTRTLGNISGGLPFTILFDAQGQVQQRKIGELSEQDLAQWASFA
jgi:peroxiredoxin